MSLSAGPVAEDTTKEEHISHLRKEFMKTGSIIDAKKEYERQLSVIRYEFGRRGMILEEKEAIKIWNDFNMK